MGIRGFAVIGLGRFGSSIAKTLHEEGHEVLGVDVDDHRVQQAMSYCTHAVQADGTDESVLSALGVANFDAVVVAVGNEMEASILVTLLAKEHGARRVIAKATSSIHGKVLERVGADRVVFPEYDMGIRTARWLISSHFLDFVELGENIGIVEFTPGESMLNKNLRELDLRAKYGISVVAIRRGEQVHVPPSPTDPIQVHDILVVIGSNHDLDRLQTLLGD